MLARPLKSGRASALGLAGNGGAGARGVPGSGLGLTLARAIVERHSGQVTLRSRVGQGTVVTMRLPVG